jgi:protein subunit release factor A
MSGSAPPTTIEEVRVEEPRTCGEGMAANAVLPAMLAALTATMADVLDVHTTALDLTDPNAKAEHDAYTRFVTEYRDITAKLEATAEQMAGSRDMPMAAHHERAMRAPEPIAAFEQLVAAKQNLLTLLQQQAEEDQQMLMQMRAVAGGDQD